MTQQQYNNFDHEIGWEDTIQKDSDRVLLPDGLYYFTVLGLERTRHMPNPQNPGKLPACNKAIVSIKIVANEGETELRHNLFLHSSTEGMLSAFFAAIGQKKKGEPLRMNWNTIIGATGVCKVGTRQYNGNNYNEVKSMLYPEDVDYTKVLNAQPAQAMQQNYQPQHPQQQQPQAGYQAGQF
ncbi:hypothetical protein [Streptococcus gordonii]|uniref:hypothetical protein n=1 Tax=Streptococcus gordonii TaxID=1302 RepID=UPI001CBEA1C8|nr:hypothetical protein [Streptococcus gordonii]MBZ2115559.1 hypothetical protein [Streptococcus gordonii]